MINEDCNPSPSPNSQFIDKNDTELKSPLSLSLFFSLLNRFKTLIFLDVRTLFCNLEMLQEQQRKEKKALKFPPFVFLSPLRIGRGDESGLS